MTGGEEKEIVEKTNQVNTSEEEGTNVSSDRSCKSFTT